jgi:hypothetical protein
MSAPYNNNNRIRVKNDAGLYRLVEGLCGFVLKEAKKLCTSGVSNTDMRLNAGLVVGEELQHT